MASFRDILRASDTDLVRLFYRVKAGADPDFIKKINHAATELGLNHTQLVCALGFNKHIRDLTDILSVVGFSSYKLLGYRRNELFTTDVYRHLPIDNVLDIYNEYHADEEITNDLRDLVVGRLANIEQAIQEHDDPNVAMSYKMEMHSLYASNLTTTEFAMRRMESPNGDLRLMIDEVRMIDESGKVPPGNLFFSDYVLPAEKRYLIDTGRIEPAMIRNRLQNREISEDERQVLEDYVQGGEA